jgi:hypothetical protein
MRQGFIKILYFSVLICLSFSSLAFAQGGEGGAANSNLANLSFGGFDLAPVIPDQSGQYSGLSREDGGLNMQDPYEWRKSRASMSNEETDKVHSISPGFAANHPADGLVVITKEQKYSELATAQSPMMLSKYTVGAADPLAAAAMEQATRFGLDAVGAINDAASSYRDDLIQIGGPQGQFGLMAFGNCKTSPEAVGPEGYPNEACLNMKGLTYEGAANARSAQSPTSTQNQQVNARNVFVDFLGQALNQAVNQGSQALGGMMNNGYQALANNQKNINTVIRKCGFVPALAPEAQCEATGTATGRVLGSIKLSHMIYPGAGVQAARREGYQTYYGDKCYLCIEGGKNDFGGGLSEDSVSFSVIDVAPKQSYQQSFKDMHKIIYKSMWTIFNEKCNWVGSAESAFADGKNKKGKDIFRISDSGEVDLAWDDGDFWRSLSVLTKNVLDGGLTIKMGLEYLSILGFRLTPSIVDAIYHSVYGAAPVPEADTTNMTKICEKFKKYESFDTVESELRYGNSIKKEIKNLFLFTQALTDGKIYDSCEPVINRINEVQLPVQIKQQAIAHVMGICAGGEDPGTFGAKRSLTLAKLDEFVNQAYRTLAMDSGRAGVSVSSSFQSKEGSGSSGPGL